MQTSVIVDDEMSRRYLDNFLGDGWEVKMMQPFTLKRDVSAAGSIEGAILVILEK